MCSWGRYETVSDRKRRWTISSEDRGGVFLALLRDMANSGGGYDWEDLRRLIRATLDARTLRRR